MKQLIQWDQLNYYINVLENHVDKKYDKKGYKKTISMVKDIDSKLKN